MARPLLAACLGFTAVLISGCSYGYTLKAEMRDGHVYFVVEPAPHKPPPGGCLDDFTVKAPTGEVMWAWKADSYIRPPCRSDLPLAYGVIPAGRRELTKAKPLKLGVVYSVVGWAGDAYSGSFRLKQAIVVDNFTPPSAAKAP